jgi:hypothetical protein
MAGNFLLIPVLTQIVGSMLWGRWTVWREATSCPVPVGAGQTLALSLISRSRGR